MLVGCVVKMDKKDESSLIKAGLNDFSIFYSLQEKCTQLILGPCAYINHDCNPNTKVI